MTTAIHIDDVSKLYRLGQVGTGTIAHDLNRWWHQVRGKEDPYAKIGQSNDRAQGNENSGKSKSKDYVWALRNINLDIKQGDILGIIGSNGAGKSTLLKLLSRVTAPSEGEIRSRGRIASLLEVGTGFHPELTGRENIYLNGAILGMSRQEISTRLDEIVDFSGCAKYIDTPTKRYSSGMTVRLGFAVAAHLDCEILIVDEVLAVGDAEFQKKSIGKMKSLTNSGNRTVLFVSHNMASVSHLCSRVISMAEGKVVCDGDPADVIADYTRKSLEEREANISDRFPVSDSLNRVTIDDINVELRPNQNGFHDLHTSVQISTPEPQDNMGIGIQINAVSGELVTRIGPAVSRFIVPTGEGSAVGEIRLPDIDRYLAGGEYSLRIWIARPGIEALLDVENAATIEIPNHDVMATGAEWTFRRTGPLILPAEFSQSSN